MNNFKPIHSQIREYILSKIESGECKPGDRLPTEKELTYKFQTSKSPVRQALGILRVEGCILRHPGRGTFVSPIFKDDLTWTIGSIQDIIGLGTQAKLHLNDFSICQPCEEVQKLFKPDKKKLFRIRGVRFLNNKPLCYLTIYLPRTVGKQMRREDVSNSSVALLLEKNLRIRLKKCVQNISAQLANSNIAAHLMIPENKPILCIERIYYTENDKIIEFARSIFNPDYFTYRSILSRK